MDQWDTWSILPVPLRLSHVLMTSELGFGTGEMFIDVIAYFDGRQLKN